MTDKELNEGWAKETAKAEWQTRMQVIGDHADGLWAIGKAIRDEPGMNDLSYQLKQHASDLHGVITRMRERLEAAGEKKA